MPITALTGPESFSRFKLPYFKTIGTWRCKVVSPKHRPPLPPGNIPGTHFCWRLSQPQGHNAAGRIMSMKNCSDSAFCCVIPKIVNFSHYQITVLQNPQYFPGTQACEESVRLLLRYVPLSSCAVGIQMHLQWVCQLGAELTHFLIM
jgi:hypothetical protein